MAVCGAWRVGRGQSLPLGCACRVPPAGRSRGGLVADVVALLRLCTQVGAGWSRGFGVQRAMLALVTTVLGRCSGCDARRQEAQASPPRGQLGEPCQGVGGARPAVVGAVEAAAGRRP